MFFSSFLCRDLKRLDYCVPNNHKTNLPFEHCRDAEERFEKAQKLLADTENDLSRFREEHSDCTAEISSERNLRKRSVSSSSYYIYFEYLFIYFRATVILFCVVWSGNMKKFMWNKFPLKVHFFVWSSLRMFCDCTCFERLPMFSTDSSTGFRKVLEICLEHV